MIKRNKRGLIQLGTLSANMSSVCVCVCQHTIEEVALALQHLADLESPDLPHARVGGVKHERLHGGIRQSASENELAGITFYVLLQTQTAHLEPSDIKRV